MRKPVVVRLNSAEGNSRFITAGKVANSTKWQNLTIEVLVDFGSFRELVDSGTEPKSFRRPMDCWAPRQSWAGDVANFGNGRVVHSVVVEFEARSRQPIGVAR